MTHNKYKVLENGLSPQVQVDGDQVSQLGSFVNLMVCIGLWVGWASGGLKLMQNLTDNEYKVLEDGLSPHDRCR